MTILRNNYKIERDDSVCAFCRLSIETLALIKIALGQAPDRLTALSGLGQQTEGAR